jgi:hypothetical protein
MFIQPAALSVNRLKRRKSLPFNMSKSAESAKGLHTTTSCRAAAILWPIVKQAFVRRSRSDKYPGLSDLQGMLPIINIFMILL